MMRDSIDDSTYEWFTTAFFTMSGAYLSGAMAPVIYVFTNIYKLLSNKKMASPKYRLLASILSIPTVIFGYKAIITYKSRSSAI